MMKSSHLRRRRWPLQISSCCKFQSITLLWCVFRSITPLWREIMLAGVTYVVSVRVFQGQSKQRLNKDMRQFDRCTQFQEIICYFKNFKGIYLMIFAISWWAYIFSYSFTFTLYYFFIIHFVLLINQRRINLFTF
jgi:hypothetical protein